MDLQKELDEIKALLNAILKTKEPIPLSEEECKKNREVSEASLLEHNLANNQGESPLPSLDISPEVSD